MIRITPAYTGNTGLKSAWGSVKQDHPRIHGEHHTELTQIESVQGSPPHTRGTRKQEGKAIVGHRITPAYTGNTQFRSFNHPLPEDHPRIHGEHYTAVKGQASDGGSPPHTRGTQITATSDRLSSGITPAYTGNTQDNGSKVMWNEDHPRIHGEHSYKTLFFCYISTSLTSGQISLSNCPLIL